MDRKRAQLREAERQRDEPVDDSKLVEQMFDFLPDSASEAQAPPAAFKVLLALSPSLSGDGLGCKAILLSIFMSFVHFILIARRQIIKLTIPIKFIQLKIPPTKKHPIYILPSLSIPAPSPNDAPSSSPASLTTPPRPSRRTSRRPARARCPATTSSRPSLAPRETRTRTCRSTSSRSTPPPTSRATSTTSTRASS